MKVLVVGGGGREHALAWALSHSPRVRRVACAPGNAGIARHAECLPLSAEDIGGVIDEARSGGYDLVVVGPEVPLVAGLADRLRDAGTPAFGPSAAAAELEGSKAFSKEFMARRGIATADFEVVDEADALGPALDRIGTPVVVKADGLAAGKGVVIADERAQAVETGRGMLSGQAFGDAGRRVVIEECLRGREASFFVLTDGSDFVELATCQDYKRIHDHDRGPNTGGMGTYSPSAFLDESTRQTVLQTIVRPTIDGLAEEGRPYRGVLYVGLMLTADGPKVLEYNVRFGDPETQVLMPRLDGDWAELFIACAEGRLAEVARPRWREQAAVCVVLAAQGYPGAYEKGLPIEGLEQADAMTDVVVFHAGTTLDESGRTVTAGGRVLGVTALGSDLRQARQRAYGAVEAIRWPGCQHRNDIAADAVVGG